MSEREKVLQRFKIDPCVLSAGRPCEHNECSAIRAMADHIAALEAPAPRVEVTEAMRMALDVLTWQVEARNNCGDPDAECPLQDACKPWNTHKHAIEALTRALTEAPADDA